MKNSTSKIRLYRFNGGTHYKGSIFPEYPNNMDFNWCETIEEAEKPYRECSIKNIDADKLEESKLFNSVNDGDEFLFIWLMLETCEVSVEAWEAEQLQIGEYACDYIGNDCDWNFETIEERGIYLNGKTMSKKMFDKIIYAKHTKPKYFKMNKEEVAVS